MPREKLRIILGISFMQLMHDKSSKCVVPIFIRKAIRDETEFCVTL